MRHFPVRWPALPLLLAAGVLWAPPAQAATCSDHENQAAAQRAADTRDADGDGIYCETLPCPCSSGSAAPAEPPPAPACNRPPRVVRIGFSAAKYPSIREHFRDALAAGWPRTLVLNRPGADARRDRLLRGHPVRAGWDRDEYPPAVGRGKGKGLSKGSGPRGWKADVGHVPRSENRSHGASLGNKLRRYCNGTRFRYVFR